MERITIKHLRALCERLNRITGSPMTYSSHKAGEPFCSNIGHFHISQAYGGYCLQRVSNTSGGVSCPLFHGHMPARHVYNEMHAFIRGLEFQK